jgi:hypothetical protein
MESRELVEVALRVLTSWSAGELPAERDVRILRQHALPHEAELPPDDLACAIVARECRLVTSQMEPRQKRKRIA